MANIKGMIVKLKTATGKYSGTDDHIYVGIIGKKGGSEFPLDVAFPFNDFEPGTVKYWLGDVWEGSELSGAKNPVEAHGWNDPENRYIDLDKVDYVYLRKQSSEPDNKDDAWKLDDVNVKLYGPKPQKRTFYRMGDIWLGNKYGLQVFLKEA